MTSSWFFLSTLNYDARSTTHQIYNNLHLTKEHSLHGNALTFGTVSFIMKNQKHACLIHPVLWQKLWHVNFKVQHTPAMALASNVFPHPGGPWSRNPRGGVTPICVYTSGWRTCISNLQTSCWKEYNCFNRTLWLVLYTTNAVKPPFQGIFPGQCVWIMEWGKSSKKVI